MLTNSVLGSAGQCIMFATINLLVLSMATAPALVHSEPADLGTFGSHNEFPQTTYALKNDDRAIVDFFYAFINYTFTEPDGRIRTVSEDQAKYGEGQVQNVRGKIVHVTSALDKDDHTACSPDILGTNGAELPAPRTWIALIKRGSCTFEEKVRHAHFKEAAGVIIYNDKDTNVLDKMKILDKDSE